MKYPLLFRGNNIHILGFISMLLLLFSLNSHAQLSGTVFKDFNNNGIQNPPNELGLRGLTVSVFVGTNTTPFVTQTNIGGNYNFTASQVPVGSKVRVEFTGLDANNAGKNGGQSRTNTQFLTIPTGGASNISLGILTNNDFCVLDGTSIFTPCYVSGNPLGGGSSGTEDALVSFPYGASGVAGVTGPMPSHIATASEVGSLWGMDYQGRGKTAVLASIVRRHVGLGPLGTGGIYKFTTTKTAVEPLIDVKTIGINTGPDPHTDLPSDKLSSSQDAASIAAAGKTGIGGISLSSDEKTLYMVNLYDRKLYSFNVGIPASTPTIASASVKSYAIPNPCSDGDYRPWGVKEYNNKLYLGVVCTSETAQDSTKLTGTIYEFNPKTGIFKIFYQFPLTYKRGEADATLDCKKIRYWKPWSDNFAKACATFFDTGRNKTVGFAINPQPIIADLEFDTDGSMIIGLMDRYGLETGFRALAPVDDGKLYDGFVSGDILRVYNNNGVFEMESNGKAGPLTGSGVGNGEGFGGGEFYGRDYWVYYGKPAHSEITNGGLLLLPGTGEILASAMDPIDEIIHSGGFHIYSNTDGKLLRGYSVYADKPGSLGKSGGVGDLKATCGDAFIEIGNRVWHDTNKDGVQDPTEDGIDGLTVTLHDMDKGGVQVASTTTTGGGIYIFNNDNVTDTVKYEHHYQIRLQMAQPVLTTKSWVEVSPGGVAILPDSLETPAEMRDSDAKLIAGFAIIDFFTGATTLSNHSLDIGVFGCTTPTNVTASSNSPQTEGAAINLTATSTNGISYAWTGPNGFTSTLQNPVISTSTLANLGIYTVKVLGDGTCTATATTNVVIQCKSITNVTASSNSPLNIGQTINLTASSTGGLSYAWKGPNNFSSSSQNPTIGSSTVAMGGIYTVTVSGNGTCTATATTKVEFLASMGDYAWYDLNKNGIQDDRISPTGQNLGKELPAKGIIMVLYKSDNTVVGKDTTDANGFYQFTKLQPGNYYVKFDPISYPGTAFVVTESNKGVDESFDSDIERVTYKSSNFSLSSGQNDPTWDIGFFRSANPTITDPCSCDLTIGYLKGDTYVYREQVDVQATPGGKWMVIKSNPKTGITTQGVFVDNGEGYVRKLDPSKENYFMTEDSLGYYSLKFAHYSATGYSLVVSDGVDTLSIGAVCYETKEQIDDKLSVLCAYDKLLQLKTQFSTGTAHYYFLADTAFKFRDNFDESTLIPIALANGEITSVDPKKYKPNSTISFYVKWVPFGTSTKGSTCPRSLFINVKIEVKDSCLAQIGDFVWDDKDRNGRQDNGEKGIPNVPVMLLDGNGNVVTKDAYGNSLVGKTTDANGFYEFIKLPPGDYQVKFGKPTNYTASPKDALIANDSNDSDADLITGISQKITLLTGERNATIDAGFYLICVLPTNVVAGSNAPINQGQALNLTATSVNGISYNWKGPNNFTSNLQNPTVLNAILDMNGLYTVTVTGNNNTCNAIATTNVIIKCLKPNAGKDTVICSPQSRIKFVSAGFYQCWKPVAGNPSAATIDSLSGQVNGMTVAGIYKFRLINGTDPKYSCEDTVAVKIAAVPTYANIIYQTTCAGPIAQNDGKIALINFSNSDKYDLQKSATYTGNLTYSLAKIIPNDGVLLQNIPNSAINELYSVRVINQNNCYTDKSFELTKNVCSCKPICAEVKIEAIKPK